MDRSNDLAEWVKVLKTVHKRRIQILAFANNHYAGHGPATVELFRELWNRQEKQTSRSEPVPKTGHLFS